MQPEPTALPWDIVEAAKRVQGSIAGKSWDDYAGDLPLRSGVERQFEVAGEAMRVLRNLDPGTDGRVPNVHRVVGMRAILIHGHAQVNDLTVRRTATDNPDEVIAAVSTLLAEAGPPEPPT